MLGWRSFAQTLTSFSSSRNSDVERPSYCKRFATIVWPDDDERITGVASGTAHMLMPDERSMAQRERFETKGYNPSRDSIEMSQGATLASEASGLHES